MHAHVPAAILAAAGALVLLATPISAQPVTTAEAADRSRDDATLRGSNEDTAIRPFHVKVPQAALDDLRRRLAATRWPDRETVADQSQGVQLATMKELVRYWQTDYDWRRG